MEQERWRDAIGTQAAGVRRLSLKATGGERVFDNGTQVNAAYTGTLFPLSRMAVPVTAIYRFSAGGGGYCEIKRVKLKILGRVRRSSGHRGASENTPAEFEREREFPTNPYPSPSPLYPPHSSGNPKASTFIASSV